MNELDLPDGFVALPRGRTLLIVDGDYEQEFVRIGLGEPGVWERPAAAGADSSSGRGATRVLGLPSGRQARLKRLRRGGLTARLWGDRFAGRRRLLDNLRVPVEAGRRGVPTARPLALLIAGAEYGMQRGWLATEELPDSIDLRRCLASAGPPTAAEFSAVLGVVRRMHDVGVEHVDLNLGNLLLRRGDLPQAFVVDLDRARLHDRPLGFALRQRALRRLERSYVKICGGGPASTEHRDQIYAGYATNDSTMASRLQRGRNMGRAWIALHRLGWRR